MEKIERIKRKLLIRLEKINLDEISLEELNLYTEVVGKAEEIFKPDLTERMVDIMRGKYDVINGGVSQWQN